MTISDQSRYALHRQLEEVLGADHASTLMAHLPPVGWADVATKHDVVALETRIDDRLAILESRILLELHRTLATHTRAMMFGMIAAMATFAGVVVAAVKL